MQNTQMASQIPPFLIDIHFPTESWPEGVLIALDRPHNNEVCEAFSVEIAGFVLRRPGSRLTRARTLRFAVAGTVLLNHAIDRPRPDLLSAPEVGGTIEPDDVYCGFNIVLPTFLSQRSDPVDIEIVHDPDNEGKVLEYILASIRFQPIGDNLADAVRGDIGIISVNSIGRSGSSLLCRVLDNHPACVVPKLLGQYGEVSIFTHYLRAIAVLSSEGAIAELNRFDHFSEFLTLPVGYTKLDPGIQGFEKEFAHNLQVLTRRGLLGLFGQIFGEIANHSKRVKPEAQYWVEKSWNFVSTNLARSLIGTWKEIILVRDIRDFYRSQTLFHQKIRSTPEELDQHAQATFYKYLHLARTYHDRRDQILLVRYEDMV